jgi:hypothetical protein
LRVDQRRDGPFLSEEWAVLRTSRRGTLAASVLALAGCSSGQRSPEVPVRYQDPEVGAARLMADETAGVRDVVNVTSAYPDPDDVVVGAAVLVDDRIGSGARPTDFERRPVFVVYTDKRAAAQAVSGLPVDRYLLNGTRVIYLPEGFPDRARSAYEEGLGIALL